MFKVSYKIVLDDNDIEYWGVEGFFQISCNGNVYGEYHDEKLELFMFRVNINDWFQRLIRVVFKLKNNNIVLLDDTESYNTAIEFKRIEDFVLVSIITFEKPYGYQDIEMGECKKVEYGDWYDEKVNINQFAKEVKEKCRAYIEELRKYEQTRLVEKLENMLKDI